MVSYTVYSVFHSLDSASTQTVSLLCIRGSGVSVQEVVKMGFVSWGNPQLCVGTTVENDSP